MKYRERKEFYSLRKFKGVGLASALVGLAFLSPSVLADEVTTQPSTAISTSSEVSGIESSQPTEVEDLVSNLEVSKPIETVSDSKHTEQSVSNTSVVESVTSDLSVTSKEVTDVMTKDTSTTSESKPSEVPSEDSLKPKVRSKRSTESDSTSAESPFVSEKAKEVTKELSDTLVMDKEDTASTSATLFKVAEGVTPIEDEKKYNKRLAEAFDDFPELVRSQVNSLTFVREPNGSFGFTYSKSGNVNINMQYYHPELTNNEPGSIGQYLGVLGHEVGHIMNARSFRDDDTWSYSRDPKYAELAKEVYNNTSSDFLVSRWASDFADYMSYLRGDYKPQGSAQEVMDYMDTLFKGILTPRADRITPELKAAVDSVNAGSVKKLVYDGHVELVADYKRLDEVKQKVQELNSAEVGKVSSKSSDHYKTYGYKTLVTTKYTANGSKIAETTLTDKGTSQLDLPGYNFVEKEVTHEGLLVEYKYSAKNTYSLDNEKLSADLDVQADPSFIGDRNKANLRFTLKEPVSNLRLSYEIQNLTTGVWQTFKGNKGEAEVDSTNLQGVSKKRNAFHILGTSEAGYHAFADLNYRLFTGAHGDNTYRMTATFFDGNTEIGSVSKTFVGKVISPKYGDLQGVSLKSQVDLNDGKTIGAIVKNGNLYRPYIGAIGNLNPETKLANLEIGKARSKDVYKNQGEFLGQSNDNRVRYTILHDDYRLNAINSGGLPVLKDSKDETTNKFLGSEGNDLSLSKKDDLGYTVLTYSTTNLSVSGITDTWGTFSYVGSDKTPRTDKVPIKVEILKVVDGKETVVDSTIVTKNIEVVNYAESLKPFFADDFQIDRRVSLGLATKSGDQYKIHYGLYGTNLEYVRTWGFGNWNENSLDSAERYRLSEVDPNKHIFLENMISLNIKKPTNAVFSDVDYTVHFDVFKRNDGKPLNFAEIGLQSTAGNTLPPKEYKEIVYWLDESGTRHELGSETSKVNEFFNTRYAIPTNAKSVEVDIQGKVPINYAPSYLIQYITDDTFEKVRDENRYLGANESTVFDSRAYTATSSLTDKLLNKKRDFTNHAIVRNKEILDAQVSPNVFGVDKRNVPLNQPFRLISSHVALASSNGQLTTNNLLNTTSILEDYAAKKFVLLEEGVRLSDASWNKQSTFEFNGKTYSLYTKPWTEGKDINESDFATNILISPAASNLISNKQYDAYTGLIYKVKEGVSVPDGRQGNSAELVYDQVERKRLDQKILSVLGETSNNNQNDVVKLKGVKIDLNTKRSLEFTVTQTVEDSNVVTRDYAKSAGKQVDVVVTLSNGAQTTSPTLEVIQKLPVGDLSYTFVAPKENSDYTVFYTSDSDVSSSSNWVSSRPSNVTGLKWVRKSALNTGTIDKVAYSIQVSDDKFRVTKSVASATILNGNLTGTVNDVAIRNDQEYRTLTIRKQTYTAGGILVENADIDVVSLPVGETMRYKDVVPNFYLDSVAGGSATQTSSDYTLPTVKPGHWDNETFVAPNRDTTMVFRFTQPADPAEARRTYTTTWENGYVEPDIQKLQTLFGNVRSYEFLPNESTQAVKKFNLIYTSGQKGVGYVDIKIEPKREKVVGIHKGITYQGDESKDLGYKETISGVNPSYDKVTNYPVDSTGTFSEVVSKENEVAAKDATVILGTKPTVKTESTPKSTTYIADQNQTVKGKETLVSEGTDGSVKTTTTYTVNPTTGDITSTDSVETVDKVDKVIKVGNKEVTTEPITMKVVYTADPNLEKDVQEVDVEGNAGVREITTTYTVSSTDGTLSNPQRTDRVTTPMVTREVRVGSVHKDVEKTPVTIQYIPTTDLERDVTEIVKQGSEGVKTTTTTYTVDENTGVTSNPTTSVEDIKMVPRVIKVGIKSKVDITKIAITTTYVEDPNLDFGLTETDEEGSEGEITVTTPYILDIQTGKTTEGVSTTKEIPMVPKRVRVGVKNKVEETPIKFGTEYEADITKPKGEQTVKVHGVDGKTIRTTTYTLDTTTGVAKENPTTEVTEKPTNEVVSVGTKPKEAVEVLAKPVRYIENPSADKGVKTTVTVGEDGKKVTITTYSVNVDGSVEDNPSTTTTTEPKEEVISVGTKPNVVETPIEFTTSYEPNLDVEVGTNTDKVVGKQGKVITTTTYTVNPTTGDVTDNPSTETREEPTNRVVSVGAKPKVSEVVLDYTTEYEVDETKPVGYTHTKVQGKYGKETTTINYTVDSSDGSVSASEPVIVRDEPTTEVIVVGAEPKVTVIPHPKTTSYEGDETKDKVTKTTKVEGKDGSTTTTITYTVNPKTGVVTPNEPKVDEVPMVETVVSVGTKPTTEVTTIPAPVKYQPSTNLEHGTKVQISKGEEGSSSVTTTYTVNPKTGDITETVGTPVVKDATPTVYSVGTKPTTEITTQPYTTTYVTREDKEVGYREVTTKGVEGTTTVKTIYTVDENTGEVTSHDGTPEVVAPITEVVEVGIQPKVDVVPIKRPVKYISDDKLDLGKQETETEGSDGSTTTITTFKVTETGEVVANPSTSETINPKEQVVRVGTKPKVDVEKVARKVTYLADATKEFGFTEVKTEGSDGSVTTTITYTVNEDGSVSPNAPTKEVVEAVTKIVVMGTKPKVTVEKTNYTTSYEEDDTLTKGETKVKVQGKEGVKTTTVTYILDTELGVVRENKPTVEDVEVVNEVILVGTKPEVTSDPIPYTTEYVPNTQVEKGETSVKTKGENGKTTTTVTYKVDKTTGKVTEKDRKVDIVSPKNEVVEVGNKPTTEVVVVPSVVRYEADTSKKVGSDNETTKGKDGSKSTTTTYNVDPKTGKITEVVGIPVITNQTETVVKVGAKPKEEVTEIPVETEYVDTPDLYVGEEKVISEGTPGSVTKTTSYSVNEKTGEVTENKPWTTTVPMKKRVVHRGTNQYKASVVANYYLEGTTEKLQESKEQKDLVVGTTYKTSSELSKAPEVTKEVKDGKETTTTVSYELVSTPENAEGKVTKEDVVVNYYYKRVVTTEVKDLTPEKPQTPEKPETPEKPQTPEKPEVPHKPEVPQKPQEAPKPTEKPVAVETPQKEEKALREETTASKRELPNTGTSESAGLGLLSGLGILSAFGLLTRRKSSEED